MAAFKALRDVSNNFENELKRVSSELFSAKIEETFEDIIAMKMRDLAMFNSKLKLLQAKPLAVTPQITETDKNEYTTINDYEDSANWKIIEKQIVKTLTQSHAVKKLITTSSRQLDPELVERKEKIIEQVTKHAQVESEFRHLDAIFKEKDDQLLQTRQNWDETLSKLKETRKEPQNEEQVTGPLYNKLQVLIGKMELMRWLIAKLVTSRTGEYDWATDPHKRLNALALARKIHTIQDYTES